VPSHIGGLKFFNVSGFLMHAMRYMFVILYCDLAILEFDLQGGIQLSFCDAIFPKE